MENQVLTTSNFKGNEFKKLTRSRSFSAISNSQRDLQEKKQRDSLISFNFNEDIHHERIRDNSANQ